MSSRATVLQGSVAKPRWLSSVARRNWPLARYNWRIDIRRSDRRSSTRQRTLSRCMPASEGGSEPRCAGRSLQERTLVSEYAAEAGAGAAARATERNSAESMLMGCGRSQGMGRRKGPSRSSCEPAATRSAVLCFSRFTYNEAPLVSWSFTKTATREGRANK